MSVPRAISESTFTLFGVPLRCAVLDNGQRVINAEDVTALFEAMESDPGPSEARFELEMAAFARWQAGHKPTP